MEETKDSHYGARLKHKFYEINKQLIQNKSLVELLNLNVFRFDFDMTHLNKKIILDEVNGILSKLKCNSCDNCNRSVVYVDLDELKGICTEHYNLLIKHEEGQKFTKAKTVSLEIEENVDDLIEGYTKFKALSTFYPHVFKHEDVDKELLIDFDTSKEDFDSKMNNLFAIFDNKMINHDFADLVHIKETISHCLEKMSLADQVLK